MARRFLPLSLPVLALLSIAARKPDNPKYENHYKTTNAPATDVVELSLNGAEGQSEFLKVDARITNKTGDQVLILRKDEAKFVVGSNTFPSKTGLLKGPVLIPPNESRSHTWSVDGADGFHVDTFALRPAGLYAGSNTGTTVAVPDFQQPPTQNTFTVGSFACNLTMSVQSTDGAQADFQCTYNGKGVGFIDARKMGARSETGKEYANLFKNAKRDVLLPGDKAKFSVWTKIPASDADMQFKAFNIVFRDSFAESSLTPITLEDWTFEVDAAKTAEMNK